jgi:NhaP-type Na+/H+ or K+/H+ antiporter
MDAFLALANIAIILLLGSLCTLLARKLRISDMLLLLLLGVFLGRMAFGGEQLFVFDDTFLMGIGVLALSMVAFDSASRFRIKERSDFSHVSFKLIGWFLLFSIIILPIASSLLFFEGITFLSFLFSAVLALVLVGTDLDSVISLLKDHASKRAEKILDVLQTEAVLSTLLTVILPFIVIDIIKDVGLWQEGLLSSLFSAIPLLFFQVIVGLGSGLIVGLVVLSTFRKFYSEHMSPITLMAGVLVAYLLAEGVGGNGTLAVAVLGFLFGTFYVAEKPKLQEFSTMLSRSLQMLVFVLAGIVLVMPLEPWFLVNSFLLFLLLLLARFAAVLISMGKDYSFKEKLLMALNVPKGFAVIVVVFALSLYHYAQLDMALKAILAVTIYSLMLSSIVDRFSKKFIKQDQQSSLALAKPMRSDKKKALRKA